MKRRGLYRPHYLKHGDARSPMRRFLEDAENPITKTYEVHYDQQWRTLFRAQRLGYVSGDGDNVRITDAGRAFLQSDRK